MWDQAQNIELALHWNQLNIVKASEVSCELVGTYQHAQLHALRNCYALQARKCIPTHFKLVSLCG